MQRDIYKDGGRKGVNLLLIIIIRMLTNSACDENIDFGKIQKLGKIPNGNSVLFFVWKEQKNLKFAKSRN
jgi:hypothetical protein